MANAIEARKGLFLLQELLSKYSIALAVVLALENLNNPLGKRSEFPLQKSALRENFIATRMSDQIR